LRDQNKKKLQATKKGCFQWFTSATSEKQGGVSKTGQSTTICLHLRAMSCTGN